MESIFVHTLRSSEMNEMMMQYTKAYKDLKCSPDIESHDLFNNVKLRHGQPRLIIHTLLSSEINGMMMQYTKAY